ncbi:hypothetical protein CANCADRAFT_32207 [Tortispora caseinolytica NRRL Y-17796]|uniref:Major facilitator superfamily (MFS) profile domain-containing protein n=1 Tax=Tortispora caseinolytica NRRL Y-17796 TaxID=767744 RepID=A0A1E4TA75_9ASCO|nr:hypothetical protein CANCADRAFT_32207 [Tortispora caseinolytica NRRL Y-17796]
MSSHHDEENPLDLSHDGTQNSISFDEPINDVESIHELTAQLTHALTREQTRTNTYIDRAPVESFPDLVTRVQDAEFPEEYNTETSLGLVPAETIRSIRRRVTGAGDFQSVRSQLSKEEEAGEPNYEFVTFTIGDKENPKHWNFYYKCYLTGLIAFVVVAVAYGSSCVTGALPLIEEKYNVSLEVAILTCSIMVLGFMVGPLLWSPASEQYGRRPVYWVSFSLYVIFNIPCALSPNIGGLLVCRFLCGVFSSSGLVVAGGSLADIWDIEQRGMAIAFFAAAPYGGPVIGPLVNGFVAIYAKRLDLVFWINMAFAGVIGILICMVPETYAPTILKNRAAKLRKETGNPLIITEQEVLKESLGEVMKKVLLRPFKLMATEPVLDLMNLYVVLIYSLLYAFFFAYPVIFYDLYGYNDAIIGLMFIPILIGAGLALTFTPYLEIKYKRICRARAPLPEDRLLGAMIGAPFIPIALFILGATSYKHIIWVGPASSGLAFGFGMVLIYESINNYIIDSFSEIAATALAAKVFMRSAGGAAFPLFTTQMYHRLGLQWASWLLAFISLAMVAIPFVFKRYGGVIRAKKEAKAEAKAQRKAALKASKE